MKQEVTVTLCSITEYSSEWSPGRLTEFIQWLNEMLEQVPPEFRESATVNIDLATGEYETPGMSIYYFRPETDGEEAAREASEATLERAYEARREAVERAEYERLKKKFSG